METASGYNYGIAIKNNYTQDVDKISNSIIDILTSATVDGKKISLNDAKHILRDTEQKLYDRPII